MKPQSEMAGALSVRRYRSLRPEGTNFNTDDVGEMNVMQSSFRYTKSTTNFLYTI